MAAMALVTSLLLGRRQCSYAIMTSSRRRKSGGHRRSRSRQLQPLATNGFGVDELRHLQAGKRMLSTVHLRTAAREGGRDGWPTRSGNKQQQQPCAPPTSACPDCTRRRPCSAGSGPKARAACGCGGGMQKNTPHDASAAMDPEGSCSPHGMPFVPDCTDGLGLAGGCDHSRQPKVGHLRAQRCRTDVTRGADTAGRPERKRMRRAAQRELRSFASQPGASHPWQTRQAVRSHRPGHHAGCCGRAETTALRQCPAAARPHGCLRLLPSCHHLAQRNTQPPCLGGVQHGFEVWRGVQGAASAQPAPVDGVVQGPAVSILQRAGTASARSRQCWAVGVAAPLPGQPPKLAGCHLLNDPNLLQRLAAVAGGVWLVHLQSTRNMHACRVAQQAAARSRRSCAPCVAGWSSAGSSRCWGG